MSRARRAPTARARVAATACLAGVVAVACGASESNDPNPAPAGSPTATDDPTPDDPTAACPTEGEEWEVAKLYIEHNETDADTGVHGLFGGEAWSVLCITDPSGSAMLLADPLERFDALAVSDLFFESREPPNDEHPIDRILTDFPEGDYTVAGIDFEGVARVGTAVFTHDIPAGPAISSPVLAEDAETAAEAMIGTTGLVVDWEPVAETIDGQSAEITGYQVIITDEEADDPNGWARPIYDVHVPSDQTSLAVPDDFLRAGRVYELEVLAIETSGNQTISLGFFATDG